MGYLFIDEKGPQNRFQVNNNSAIEEKISLGTDRMHSYLANVWYINKDYEHFKNEYLLLERGYLDSTQNPDRELKGADILKGKFQYGVASAKMKNNDIEFYTDLFKILLKFKSKNLLFSISKMSIIVDSRLLEWIYLVEEKRFYDSAYILKYILTKYLRNEASSEVVSAMLDLNKGSKDILNLIQRDMQKLVNENKANRRMKHQVEDYKVIIKLIIQSKHYSIDKSDEIVFDWNKVRYDFDLWLIEKTLDNEIEKSETELYLDNGIQKKTFEGMGFKKIFEDVDSKDEVGIRITDFLVAIAGNYIKNLRLDLVHDSNIPEKVTRLSSKWFDLNEQSFNLLKLMRHFFFSNGQFSIVVDTFFDDEVTFESFLDYIDAYHTYDEYKLFSHKDHVAKQFVYTSDYYMERWNKGGNLSICMKNVYGSTRKAIEFGDLRPL